MKTLMSLSKSWHSTQHPEDLALFTLFLRSEIDVSNATVFNAASYDRSLDFTPSEIDCSPKHSCGDIANIDDSDEQCIDQTKGQSQRSRSNWLPMLRATSSQTGLPLIDSAEIVPTNLSGYYRQERLRTSNTSTCVGQALSEQLQAESNQNSKSSRVVQCSASASENAYRHDRSGKILGVRVASRAYTGRSPTHDCQLLASDMVSARDTEEMSRKIASALSSLDLRHASQEDIQSIIRDLLRTWSSHHKEKRRHEESEADDSVQSQAKRVSCPSCAKTMGRLCDLK